MSSYYGGGSGYSGSYVGRSSFSSGIWQGSNALFPTLPHAHPPPPVTSAPMAKGQPTSLGGQHGISKKPAFKLRRAIHPKAPLTILNELAGVGNGKVLFEYLDVPDEERRRRAWQADMDVEEVGSFECRCTALGLEFIAEGITKPEAKTAVVEIAIQGLISVKCQKNEEGFGPSEDNCPWSLIASLALHKLYNSWQSLGYSLPPELTSLPGEVGWVGSGGRGHGGCGGLQTISDRVVVDKPPLQLVNEMASRMRCTLDFQLTSEAGTPNDKVFTMSVMVGEKKYSGQGKNKKSAKQAAASAALKDQETWYNPPTQPSVSSVMEEQQEEPPVKRRTLLNPEEIVTLKRKDGRQNAEDKAEEDPDTVLQDEDVLEGPEKGLLPGSHPSNVK